MPYAARGWITGGFGTLPFWDLCISGKEDSQFSTGGAPGAIAVPSPSQSLLVDCLGVLEFAILTRKHSRDDEYLVRLNSGYLGRNS